MKKAQQEAESESQTAQTTRYIQAGYEDVMNKLDDEGVRQMISEGVLVPTDKNYEV